MNSLMNFEAYTKRSLYMFFIKKAYYANRRLSKLCELRGASVHGKLEAHITCAKNALAARTETLMDSQTTLNS